MPRTVFCGLMDRRGAAFPTARPDGCRKGLAVSTLNGVREGERRVDRREVPDSRTRLARAFDQLIAGNGTYEFILLRPAPLDENLINSNTDIDLLGSASSEASFLAAAFALVRQGLCHLHISRNDARKTKVVLFSTDGSSAIHIDLWKDLWQTTNFRRVRIEFFEKVNLSSTTNAILRLPILLESCLYIQHLRVKRKTIHSHAVQERLRYYRHGLEKSGYDLLAENLSELKKTGHFAKEILRLSEFYLENQGGLSFPAITRMDRIKRALGKITTLYYRAPDRARLFALMGCDGVGKTSISRELLDDKNDNFRSQKGKSLYRRSVVYNLLAPLRSVIASGDPDKFEERLSGTLYIVASSRLRLKLLFRSAWGTRRPLILDRTPADLLFHDRKNDEARMSRSVWLEKLVGVRVPVVHLVADYDCVASRKREVTLRGQAAYDESMFDFHQSQSPVNYTVFWNGGDRGASGWALRRILHETVLRR